jgi:predicted site-specific integrase-resolvase
MSKKTVQKITLSVWAEKNYGVAAPCQNTLRAWARTGRIQPEPVKTGRAYMAHPDAQYITKDKK